MSKVTIYGRCTDAQKAALKKHSAKMANIALKHTNDPTEAIASSMYWAFVGAQQKTGKMTEPEVVGVIHKIGELLVDQTVKNLIGYEEA